MAGLGKSSGSGGCAARNGTTIMKTRREPIAPEVPLIFEESVPGRRGADLPPRAFPSRAAVDLIGADLCRAGLEGLPEVSEPQVMRHFLRLSQLNFAQALQFYPLGSCTMKYNPPLNDESAGLPGFAGLHPLTSRAPGAGRVGVDGPAGGGAGRDQRDGRHLAASGGRSAGRVGRPAHHPRLSSESAAGPATKSLFPTPRTAPTPQVRRWPAFR